jgi:serine/threonine protein kinase
MDPEPSIGAAIRAIVAGDAVDWEALNSSDSGDVVSAFVRDLRVISAIASLTSPADIRPHIPEQLDHSDPAAGPTWGALTVLERVGGGSFGDVFRAWDARLEREVALKLLKRADDPGPGVTSFVSEGRALARVRHPNIVTVYGADIIDGRVGIWMEFVHGKTLETLVRERGPLPAPEVMSIGVAVCRALAAIHRTGFVHRDVKAQNVMREEEGRIVLMDFGTVQEHSRDHRGLAGTPTYVAPEVLAGAAATPQSDGYSVGVLLFYLATGSYPVYGSTVEALIAAHREEDRRKLGDVRKDLPAAFGAIVDRALAPSPPDRFQSITAMEDALAAALGGPARGRMLLLVTALAAVLVLAGVSVWRSTHRNPDRADVVKPAVLFGSGQDVRNIDVAGFIAAGPPSSSGRWLAGIDWNASGNVALLDLLSGDHRTLTASNEVGYTEKAAISPDEQTIAYSWYFSGRQDSSELRTVSRAGGQYRTIFRNAEGVTTPVAWSPDGQRVLALIERAHRPVLAWIDPRTQTATDLRTLSSFPRNISLSPSGTQVVYDSISESGTDRDLYSCDAITGQTSAILVQAGSDLAPVWTPDGKGIVFSSDRGGTLGLWHLAMVSGQASGDPDLVRGDIGRFSPIGFGRDGALLFQAITGTVDVYTAALDLQGGRVSSPRVVATSFVGRNLSSGWSPDGHSLALTSRRGDIGFERGSQALVIRDLRGTSERVLTPDLSDMSFPRWSSDARSLLLKGDGPHGEGIYRVSVSDGAASLVLPTSGPSFPEWRPDGRAIFFVKSGEPNHLEEFEPETGLRKTIVDRVGGYSLSHDGFRFAFKRNESDGVHIYLAPTAGGAAMEIATLPRTYVVELAGWTPGDEEVVISERVHAAGRESQPAPTVIKAFPASGGNPRTLGVLKGHDPRSIRLSPDGTSLAFDAGYPRQSMWVLEHFLDR